MKYLFINDYINYILSSSAGPQMIPPQTYDYAALNALALDPDPSAENDGGSGGNTAESQANIDNDSGPSDDDDGDVKSNSSAEDNADVQEGLGNEQGDGSTHIGNIIKCVNNNDS